MDEVFQSVFDEIDLNQVAIVAQLSPARRLGIMFDLIEFLRQLQFADEKQQDPDATEEDLWLRVRERAEMSYDPLTLQRLYAYRHRNA